MAFGIRKSNMGGGDIDRLRSTKYLRHVRSKSCLICGGTSEAHHITYAQHRAKGVKNGDQWVVPLCHAHHMMLHDFAGGEKTWWAINGINPLIWAEEEYSKWKEERNGELDW